MEDTMKTIWLPNFLYQAIPPLCIIIGFFIAALAASAHNPFGIILAAGIYLYSFFIMLMRVNNQGKHG